MNSLPRPASDCWQDWLSRLNESELLTVASWRNASPYHPIMRPITAFRLITGERITVIDPTECDPRDLVIEAISKLGEVFYSREVAAKVPHVPAKAVHNHVALLRQERVIVRTGRNERPKGWPYRRGPQWEMAFIDAQKAILGASGAGQVFWSTEDDSGAVRSFSAEHPQEAA